MDAFVSNTNLLCFNSNYFWTSSKNQTFSFVNTYIVVYYNVKLKYLKKYVTNYFKKKIIATIKAFNNFLKYKPVYCVSFKKMINFSFYIDINFE